LGDPSIYTEESFGRDNINFGKYMRSNSINSYTANNNQSSDHNLTEQIVYEKIKENNYYILKQCFILAEKQLERIRFDATFSGTTGVLIIIIGNKIISINAGDSRGILCHDSLIRNFNYFKECQNTSFVVQLSQDHKPDLPFEKARVVKCGGRVDRYTECGIKYGPFRVWKKNENWHLGGKNFGCFSAKTNHTATYPA